MKHRPNNFKKFHQLKNNSFDIRINCLTNEMRTLFQLKDLSLHTSCEIYERICSCGESYIGETVRNVQTRWSVHSAPRYKSNPSKH